METHATLARYIWIGTALGALFGLTLIDGGDALIRNIGRVAGTSLVGVLFGGLVSLVWTKR